MEISPPVLGMDALSPLGDLQDPNRVASGDEAEKIQAAKDFESVLLAKVLDEMKDAIVNWSGDEDAATQQVGDIFWQFLARDLGDKGGLGLWKDIYHSLQAAEQTGGPSQAAE